jgi:translation elongation factor EF-Tu-like GTPase
MAKIGTFKIESSFKLTDRGLVALGQIVDGCVKIGAYTNIEVGNDIVIMQISGVEMADINRENGVHAVGLTFGYRDEMQRNEFETMKLKEQLIDILAEPGPN